MSEFLIAKNIKTFLRFLFLSDYEKKIVLRARMGYASPVEKYKNSLDISDSQ